MPKYYGCPCEGCGKPLTLQDDIVVCPDCGAPYHRTCYEKMGLCIHAPAHGAGYEWKFPYQDAQLRTEFNITTGPKIQDMAKIKFKSAMKEYYAKAGLPTARYHLVQGLDDALEFAHYVGYPVVVKPDNGQSCRTCR